MTEGLDELRNKAFNGRRWMERNLAVKELGKMSGNELAKSTLLEMLSDQRPAVWWRRLLGEPFFQVGFTRRNVWQALLKHQVSFEEISEKIDVGLEDPYYEVRTATWTLLSKVIGDDSGKLPHELKKDLRQRIVKEDNFEILTAALGVFDRVCEAEYLLEWASRVDCFKHWRVRAAYLGALERCCDRGELCKEKADVILKRFNLRSEYFRPVFMLKEHGSRLEQSLKVEG